jgi:hypothetical protein
MVVVLVSQICLLAFDFFNGIFWAEQGKVLTLLLGLENVLGVIESVRVGMWVGAKRGTVNRVFINC